MLRNDFIVYDDPVYVTENLHVQRGLAGNNFIWAFNNTESSNWHPVTWFSHMLDVEVFGLNPRGHHLSSLLLHAGNTVLVFLVFRRLTGCVWRSLLLAALFGLHPLRVESVAWVSERKDVLSGFFWLLTIWTYVEYVRCKTPPAGEDSQESRSHNPQSQIQARLSKLRQPLFFFFLALLFFVLGLMSKPMLVTLPCVLLLLDFWPLRRVSKDSMAAWRALVFEKLPFFVLAAGTSVVTFLVQKSFGAVQRDLPFLGRVENAAISYCRYIEKCFFPKDLAIVYPYVNHWPPLAILCSALLLLGICAVVLVFGRRHRYLPVGWFWFVGTLVPVIGLVQVGRQSLADRYTYIPCLGVLLLLIWGAHALVVRQRHLQLGGSIAVLAALLVCIKLTRQQISYWQDSERLFRQAIAITKGNYIAHYCLGFTLDKQKRFDEAIAQYEQALKLYPDYPDAHNNLGFTLRQQGKLEQAIGHFQEALRLNPWNAPAHFNLGFAFSLQGRVDEAIEQYQQALQLRPEYPDALNNLGVALARKGKTEEAIAAYQRAARLAPGSAEICYNLANALFRHGREQEAIAQFQKVLDLEPKHAEAHNNLGVALSGQKRFQEAIVHFQQAVTLKPDYLEARKNLAAVLRFQSKPEHQSSATAAAPQ